MFKWFEMLTLLFILNHIRVDYSLVMLGIMGGGGKLNHVSVLLYLLVNFIFELKLFLRLMQYQTGIFVYSDIIVRKQAFFTKFYVLLLQKKFLVIFFLCVIFNCSVWR